MPTTSAPTVAEVADRVVALCETTFAAVDGLRGVADQLLLPFSQGASLAAADVAPIDGPVRQILDVPRSPLAWCCIARTACRPISCAWSLIDPAAVSSASSDRAASSASPRAISSLARASEGESDQVSCETCSWPVRRLDSSVRARSRSPVS